MCSGCSERNLDTKVTKEAQVTRKDGKERWIAIRSLQLLHRGCRPQQSAAVWRKDGQLTSSPEEVRERWHEHFSEVLNITSTFPQQELDELPTRRPHMLTALGKLKL